MLDGRAGTVLGTVQVGRYPIGIAVDGTACRAYVVNNRASTLSVVDETSLSVVKTARLPGNVSSTAIDTQNGLLYLALKGENRVAVVRVTDF
jgi:DNA-binding beta-propeller fold protein YncE